MALVGVELETLIFEPDAQTTRLFACRHQLVQFKKLNQLDKNSTPFFS